MVSHLLPFYDVLDHSCGVRHCVRPSHLRPMTIYDNLMLGGGNAASRVSASRTHCQAGHLYDDANTRYQGPQKRQRACRACAREFERKYRAQRKARGW